MSHEEQPPYLLWREEEFDIFFKGKATFSTTFWGDEARPREISLRRASFEIQIPMKKEESK